MKDLEKQKVRNAKDELFNKCDLKDTNRAKQLEDTIDKGENKIFTELAPKALFEGALIPGTSLGGPLK